MYHAVQVVLGAKQEGSGDFHGGPFDDIVKLRLH